MGKKRRKHKGVDLSKLRFNEEDQKKIIKKFVEDFYKKHHKLMTKLAYE